MRDAKQHRGLCDGQMRHEQGLDFHGNTSRSVLNLMYAQEKARVDDGIFSLVFFKRRKFNENLLQNLCLQLHLSQDSDQCLRAIRPIAIEPLAVEMNSMQLQGCPNLQ